MMTSAVFRVTQNHPEYEGKIVDPHSIPRPRDVRLIRWLQTDAPEKTRIYCREGLAWTRKHPSHALPGFLKLDRELSSR